MTDGVVKITVDPDKCQGYGQCCFEAGEVFELVGDPPVRHPAEVDETLRSAVEMAADVCPMQAISID